jgi:hypothetical protein
MKDMYSSVLLKYGVEIRVSRRVSNGKGEIPCGILRFPTVTL